MGASMMIGALLTLLGPSLGLFIFSISHDNETFIVILFSSFFYIISQIIPSFFISLMDDSKVYLFLTICISVMLQELVRVLCWFLVMFLDMNFFVFLRYPKKYPHKYAYISGLSFGLTFSILNSVNIIYSLWSDSDIPFDITSEEYYIYLGIINLVVVILQISWSICVFYGMNTKKYYIPIFVTISHWIISLTSTIKIRNKSLLCSLYLIISFMICIVTYFISTGRIPCFEHMNSNQVAPPSEEHLID